VTKYGEAWTKDIANSPISKEMAKLLKRLGIGVHRNFYTLRHTHRTVADESRDQARRRAGRLEVPSSEIENDPIDRPATAGRATILAATGVPLTFPGAAPSSKR
jgi:hypothetical protein